MNIDETNQNTNTDSFAPKQNSPEMMKPQTETIQMPNAMQSGNALLRAVFQSNLLYVVKTDVLGNYTYVNDFFCEKFGLNRAEILGKSSLLSIAEADHQKCKATIERCFAYPNVPQEVVLCKNMPTGMCNFSQWEFTGVTDELGAVFEILCIGYSLTTQIVTERALHESEARLHEVLENSVVAMYKRNLLTQQYEYLSPVFTQLTGYTIDDFLTFNSAKWEKIIHAEDLGRIQKLKNEAISNKLQQSFQVDVRLTCADGQVKWFSDHFSVQRDNNGNAEAFIGSISDVNESKLTHDALRKSESLYKMLANNSTDVIWTMDLQGKFTYISPSVEKLRGFTVEEIMVQPFTEVVSPGSQATVVAALKERIESAQNGTPVAKSVYEVEQPCKDGSTVWTEVVTDLMYDETGSVAGIIGVSRNISVRKKAQDALRENMDTFRALVNQMQSGLAVHEIICNDAGLPVDYRFLEVNPSFEKLTGLEREKIIGRTVLEIMPNTEKEWIEKYGRVALTGESLKYQNFSRELGKHYSVVAYQPREREFAVIVDDVTTQVLADNLLKESEEKFRQLVQDMSVGVILQNGEAKIFLSNPKALELLGLSEDQLLGKTSFDPDWNVIHEDGSPFPGETHPVPRAIALKKPVRGIIMGVYRPENRDRVWLQVDAEPQFTATGEVRHVVCSFIDISERKKIEEALRESNSFLENLINYANAPIIVWDPQFCISRFNHAFETLTGRKESEVLGKSIELLFPPELVERSMEHIRKTLTGERWITVEIEILHVDGTTRTVLWNSATLFTANGKMPVATITQGQDVTERIRAEKKIKTANLELKRLNSEKDKLFSIVAHDLRSPFHGLLGVTRLLAENSLDLTNDEIKEYGENLHVSVLNLYKLVQNLLEWAQFQKGSIKFAPETLNLSVVVLETIAVVKQKAIHKEIAIHSKMPIGQMVYADEKMLSSVLRNLLTNAIKFTHRNGAVTIAAKELHNGYVEISVTDTGVGIPESGLPAIFSLGEKTRSLGTENEPSTGLGLILSKEFVEKNGGQIRVESTEGVGSTFYFTLPVSKEVLE